MRRRHPLPRSAQPAPSDTKQPHQPAPLAHVRLAIRSRAFPANLHRCPFSRRGHTGTASFCSGINSVGAHRAPRPSRRPRTTSEPPVAGDGNPRAVDPPPAATVTRRIAVHHASRQIQRREHRPHPLPRPARRPPPDRVQLVHHRHQVPELSTGVDVARAVGRVDTTHQVLCCLEQLPVPQRQVHLWRRRRPEPGTVVPFNREQPAARNPSRAGDVQASSFPIGQSRSRSASTCRPAG